MYIGAFLVYHGESMYGLEATENDVLYGKTFGGMVDAGVGYIAAFDNLYNTTQTKTGQAKRAPIIINCPASEWIKNRAEIQNAIDWLEDNRDEVFVASSTAVAQPGSSGNSHPSALGSILLGLHSARCWKTVCVDGQNYWIPDVELGYIKGKEIILPVEAMSYPMRFQEWFGYLEGQLETQYQWGFEVVDAVDNEYELAKDPEFVNSGKLIRLTLKNEPPEPPIVRHCLESSDGYTNIFDSQADFSDWDYRDNGNTFQEVTAFTEGEDLFGGAPLRPFELQTQVYSSS
jgi:hypothetical protein